MMKPGKEGLEIVLGQFSEDVSSNGTSEGQKDPPAPSCVEPCQVGCGGFLDSRCRVRSHVPALEEAPSLALRPPSSALLFSGGIVRLWGE
eukprot:1161293-Pelagomonas_calceolata.AAC.5